MQKVSPRIRSVRYFIGEILFGKTLYYCFTQVYKALYGDAMFVCL